jgi:hypothetical protein
MQYTEIAAAHETYTKYKKLIRGLISEGLKCWAVWYLK